MSWPNVATEFETFFEPTRLHLFGKPFPSLTYNRASMEKAQGNDFMNYTAQSVDGDQLRMPPSRIERTLRKESYEKIKTGGPDSPETEVAIARIFARIYSFSYEGHYYRLPRPLLFLLSGDGKELTDKKRLKDGTESPDKQLPKQRGSRRPDDDETSSDYTERHAAFQTKFSGVAGEDWQFSDDIKVWAVDRKDLAVCLDVEIANYQEILLQPMASRGGPSRGDMVSRGDVIGRGSDNPRASGAFRGDMIGPHQNW